MKTMTTAKGIRVEVVSEPADEGFYIYINRVGDLTMLRQVQVRCRQDIKPAVARLLAMY